MAPSIPPPAAQAFGHRVRLAREQRQRTQRQLAKEAGVSNKYLSRVEQGKADPSLSVALRLAQALGISLDELANASGGEHAVLEFKVKIPIGLPKDLRKFHRVIKALNS